MEKENEKQISQTEWPLGNGKCKIRIVTEGEISIEDIKVQAEYTIYGLGYGYNVEPEEE